MKTTFLPIILIVATIISFTDRAYSQVPDFGSVTGFALFTSAGAVSNTAVSHITGHIGTNNGAITGFSAPSTVSGNIYNADAVTAQCITDLEFAYAQLYAIPATNSSHAPAFGTGETLLPAVYTIAGASSVAGTLILDAQGDPNAVFIFKIGGAFTTGASATIVLVNQASARNVFWIAEGAISMATLTMMKGTLIAHPGAVSMGDGCQLEGRLFSTTGAVSVYGVISSAYSGNTTWTGAAGTANWFTAANWTNAVPDGASEALIPSTLLPGRFFPLVDTGLAIIDSMIIEAGASVTITNSVMQIRGAILNSGTMNATNGSIVMAGLSGQSIAANTFQNNAVNNLIISNISDAGVVLDGALNIFGSLTYSGNGMQLTTNDLLTIKSTAMKTARVGNMNGNLITGKVTVERYIYPGKGWRFLSIPTNSNQSIKECWQEGATITSSDPVHGYGTQVTSNNSTWSEDGFDMFSANGPSMKVYNDLTNGWTGVTNTNIQGISISGGYMIFIRGDRYANTFNSAPSETVLRTTGYLYTGDQYPININPDKFASIGNPYASAVDMRLISKMGLKDFFYVWDPNLVISSGQGGYQTFSYNGTDYVVSPGLGSYGAAGSINNYVQSGQAFLVQAGITGGSLMFREQAKQ